MKIELHEIPVREICDGYKDSEEEGVFAYGGKLNVRPKYQREFIYDDKERKAVIETVNKGFPLNVMYWAENDDGSFEILDGQQRTLSLCQYVDNVFSLNNVSFHSLTETEKNRILDYKLMIYICEGNDKEKLDWFRTINIAGEKLTDQELRNATYTGAWLTDAKRRFSKSNCPAYGLASKYMNGSPIRQDYLETALKWISNDHIEEYMDAHKTAPNAIELWLYFQSVIAWVQAVFPVYRKEMKGLDWGILFNQYGKADYDSKALESRIKELMEDEDVTNKKGIYEYLLSSEERKLNLRAFTDKMKREAYEWQNGFCKKCNQHFEFEQMEGDHIVPWAKGGKTTADNCQMLCRKCNAIKSDK